MVKKTNLAFNNWSWSEATELTLSDSMSIVSGSKLEFRVLLLAAGRKPEHPGEKPSNNKLNSRVKSAPGIEPKPQRSGAISSFY